MMKSEGLAEDRGEEVYKQTTSFFPLQSICGSDSFPGSRPSSSLSSVEGVFLSDGVPAKATKQGP